ncbi:MAG TPA: universal stress protein [Caulobacteraceae bacterium]|nr:universal stress protein [Caulobacteraceae bacterium]
MLRDLLVHVGSGEPGRQRVKLAVDLALRTGARLSGLHVTPPAEIAPVYKPSQVGAAVARKAAALTAAADLARAIFEAEAIRRLPNASWFEAEGDVVEGVCRRSRFADLVILGRDEWQDPPETHPLPIAHSVVLHCGRPVLVVPIGAPFATFAKVAVAWDGSREAVRAIHDALPLLKLAQAIDIITMIRPHETMIDAEVEDLTTHLANHGIAIAAKVDCAPGAAEHKTLQGNIDRGAYELVVMGGYSHPQWMEFIFGGATMFTLMSSKIPVFLSH